MRYVSNPKHREPWQPGRRGALCPKEVWPHAQALLEGSEERGGHRYAVFEGKLYKGQKSDSNAAEWHGYPVGISEVPAEVVSVFVKAGKLTNRDIRKLKRK